MKKITRIEPTSFSQKTKKLRVAAYCRVSTGMDDQLVSLETQKAHYEEYITGNPAWIFAGLYYDEGISGTKKEKRPALLQMISDCEAGKIDYILTKSLSRFVRNTADCLELVRKLLNLGIPIFFEKENLDTGSMESELMLSMIEKTITVSGKEVKFRSSATVPRLYRIKFGRDIFKDLAKLEKSYKGKKEDGDELQIEDLEIFENVAYIMAWHADPTIPGTIDEWLEQFEMFSIYEVLPEILQLWGTNLITDAESKKNMSGRRGK